MSNQTYCVKCGAEMKDNHLLNGSGECFSCRCAKNYLKKKDHASSTQQAKGLKKLFEQGTDFAQKLFVKNN